MDFDGGSDAPKNAHRMPPSMADAARCMLDACSMRFPAGPTMSGAVRGVRAASLQAGEVAAGPRSAVVAATDSPGGEKSGHPTPSRPAGQRRLTTNGGESLRQSSQARGVNGWSPGQSQRPSRIGPTVASRGVMGGPRPIRGRVPPRPSASCGPHQAVVPSPMQQKMKVRRSAHVVPLPTAVGLSGVGAAAVGRADPGWPLTLAMGAGGLGKRLQQRASLWPPSGQARLRARLPHIGGIAKDCTPIRQLHERS